MRVLIAEDDVALGRFLLEALRLDGHEVELVENAESALEVAEELQPELAVLDLNWPRKDGMAVLRELAERSVSTAVLVLTGQAEMEERVRCLDMGADDVMQKPFSLHELRARLRALGRRRNGFGQNVLRFGDLLMNRAERRVTQAGREVELTATEFSLLESLLRRRGERVCSRKELLREVWRTIPAGAGTNIVEVYVTYLRRKLGCRIGRRFGAARIAICTVRGQGYVLRQAGVSVAGIGSMGFQRLTEGREANV